MNAPIVRELTQAEVPAGACTNCPKKAGFGLTGIASHCLKCVHHGGFVELPGNGAAAFDRRFQVICTHPIGRSITMVDM